MGTEGEVMTMEKLLNQFFENANQVALITDEHFRIRYVSQGVEQLFGVSSIKLLGQNAFDLITSEQKGEWQQCLAEANLNKSGEISFTTISGSQYHLDVSVTNLIQHEQVRGLVILIHDLTQRTKTQLALSQANQQLSEYIFKVTHDLKAPVNSVLGLLALADNASEEDRKTYLSLAKTTLQKMGTLIKELSVWHEVDRMAIVKKSIDVNEFFQQEIDLLRNQPEARNIQIVFEVIGTVELRTDPIRLQAIFTNILSNSIKYIDRTKEQSRIDIRVTVGTDHCEIEIEDNGIGMDALHLPKIFDKYYRVNPDSDGTGLGLHIVKDTLERLGGQVRVSSAPGVGSTFSISIPNFLNETSRLSPVL